MLGMSVVETKDGHRVGRLRDHFRRPRLPTAVELRGLGGIAATMASVGGGRTPEKGALYCAICTWNGRRFEARARNGASYELCRQLLAAGVPERALQVEDELGRLRFTILSVHDGARWTIRESSREPIHLVRWEASPWCRVSP
jgi:hypothetical protein